MLELFTHFAAWLTYGLLGLIFVILLANFVLVGWVINALGARLFAGF
ncbi:hypothetical protein [Marinobacterium aestuariivivens]|uniref:Uncharacterized protein n=1 Tax=Marinobacterium aestuariivivens TaxID=1698799 RepID=A0ABW2A8L6_9GAMM